MPIFLKKRTGCPLFLMFLLADKFRKEIIPPADYQHRDGFSNSDMIDRRKFSISIIKTI